MQLLSYSSTPHPLPWPGQSPSVDLQLSISVGGPSVEALKWEAAEQMRLAGVEKAYAEHVMEMSRREMEVAQTEFLRARSLWERAREEVQRAHKMRERAAGMEITCLSCRHKFRPTN
ncbi:hypothetical protein SASPL_117850 [Salvia splendens]|uniref:Uncharacterized protein n=2 Tax=Salvia splendens TaxID=180675 RepID=A0A8X8XWK8_SALSN|nr:hypothetical protein SASPL_117850 [Salvia splendens]